MESSSSSSSPNSSSSSAAAAAATVIHEADGKEEEEEPDNSEEEVFIVHFNDVYNIEARKKEPVGGAARFVTLLNAIRSNEKKKKKMASNPPPLVMFSGDAFNPSIMSTVLKGKQMVEVLNRMSIHTAIYGNHDFDFGVDTLSAGRGV